MMRITPLRWFAIATIALAVGAAYSTYARERTLPPMVGYVPKESRVIVATEDIAALWRGVAHHFFSRRTAALDSAPLEELAAQLDADLRERDIVIRGPEDLAAYGIDAGRGMLVALHVAQTLHRGDVGVDETTDAVAVVPITDFALFVASLARAMDAEATVDTTVLRDGVRVPVTSIGGSVHAIEPEDGVAVVGSSVGILTRSVADRPANRTYFRANDLLYAGLRRLRRQQRFPGPKVLVHARPPSVQGIGSITGAVTLGSQGIELLVDVEVGSGFVRVLDDLMTAVPGAQAGIPPLPQTVGGVVAATGDAFFDSSLLKRWLVDALADWPGPITDAVDELRSTDDVDQLALTIAGSDDGVPETVLMARGAPPALADLVSRLRWRLVTGRDRAVLEAAREEHGGGETTVQALLDAGLLTGGDDQRWPYYRFDGNDIVFDTTVSPSRLFPASAFERRAGDVRIQLLSPPVTADDRRYNEALADADSALLASDRYRVAAVQLDSTLWLGPDADVLVAFRHRLPPAVPALADRPVYRDARRNGPAAPTLELFLDVERLIALGLLDTDADVQATAKRVLAQLRDHQALSVTLAPVDASHLRLTARLLRGGGDPAP